MKKLIITAVACVTTVASAMVAAPASALDIPTLGGPTVLASDLFLPLSLAVGAGGTAYVSQNGPGLLNRISPDGTTTVIASATPGDELGAVSVRSGTVYYATNTQDHTASALFAMPAGGESAQLGDLYAYESTANPDQVNTYGFVDLPKTCLDQFDPASPLGPAQYTGIVDTHPYASLPLDDGVYVADAGANAVLKVGYDGAVSTAAKPVRAPRWRRSAQIPARRSEPRASLSQAARMTIRSSGTTTRAAATAAGAICGLGSSARTANSAKAGP